MQSIEQLVEWVRRDLDFMEGVLHGAVSDHARPGCMSRLNSMRSNLKRILAQGDDIETNEEQQKELIKRANKVGLSDVESYATWGEVAKAVAEMEQEEECHE